MSQIRFTTPAKLDLGQIFEYIAKDNLEAAIRHRQRLEECWSALIQQPRMGTKRDEIKSDMRSLTEGNYVIFYRSQPDGIEICRVLHASRDTKRAFAQSKA